MTEPAEPRIHAATRPGAVHLTVADLDGLVAFYRERLGLAVHRREAGRAHLGAGSADLLVLHERPGAPRTRGTTGLYHVALLVPSRRDLARVLHHLAETGTPLAGASDHAVSEALYLSDPEGNGFEIYRDRPRAEWPSGPDGVRMATDRLDLAGLLAERGGSDEAWAGMAAGTRVGHIHLRVARLDEAERFYAAVLGFDVRQRYGDGALFLSAGGYHHHIGLNTWDSVGLPPPPDGAAGLRHFTLELPDRTELERVRGRLQAAGEAMAERAEGLEIRDPSGHRIRFVVVGTNPPA